MEGDGVPPVLQDGSAAQWKLEVDQRASDAWRGIHESAKVHNSVMKRVNADPDCRVGNPVRCGHERGGKEDHSRRRHWGELC